MLSHVSDGFRNVVTAHVLKCVANVHSLKFLVPAGGLCDEELYGLLSHFHGVGPSLANCDVKTQLCCSDEQLLASAVCLFK